MLPAALLVDAAVSLGSMAIAPAFDFIKKKFIKSASDTPERTIGSLATTKPEVLPDYIKALTELKTANIAEFNRDVVGTISPWVSNLRASIRPIAVIGAGLYLVILTGLVFSGYDLTAHVPKEAIDMIAGIRLSAEAIISSWFGSRISLSSK